MPHVEEIKTDEKVKNEPLTFTNDLSDIDKQSIRDYSNNMIEDILGKSIFSINDLTHVSFVAHGSIKSRSKNTKSAREIIMGVITKTRATSGKTATKTKITIKEVLEKLTPEQRNIILNDPSKLDEVLANLFG